MTETRVWVIDLPVHVIADSAELARDHLAHICDKGEVTLTSGTDSVTVLYANYPEDRGNDGQNPYNWDSEQGAVTR